MPPSPCSVSASGAAEQAAQHLGRERLQHEHAGAAEKCADDLEGRVLGGGADEGDGAGLDVGQECVLLRLVEAVYLVAEEDGAAAGGA
jgi:hypothetical protein